MEIPEGSDEISKTVKRDSAPPLAPEQLTGQNAATIRGTKKTSETLNLNILLVLSTGNHGMKA